MEKNDNKTEKDEMAKNDSGHTTADDEEVMQPTTSSAVRPLDIPKSPESADDASLQIKHALQHTWTLWYLENGRGLSWEEMQNQITDFDTVEDFWSIYNHIKQPSELYFGCEYSLFKKGIRPMWEDAANFQGGRWMLTLAKIDAQLDRYWLHVCLLLIGELCEHYEDVCGAVVGVRAKSNKVSLWTANSTHIEAIMEIGHKMKETLGVGDNRLHYQLHSDQMAKQGLNVKTIFQI